MAQYIDRYALVAEIERLIDDAHNGVSYHQSRQNVGLNNELSTWEHLESAFATILKIINTLEVKEWDLEKDVRQILSLYYEGIKHYDDIIKKEREENGGSDLAIKIMDGVVDARELGIQYVIDKLKAQKGE